MFLGRALRGYLDRGALGMTPAVLGATVVVGIASGLIGALYLLVLHLLQHALWPDHVSRAAGVRGTRRDRRRGRRDRPAGRESGRRRAARRQHSRLGNRTRRAHAAITRPDVAPHHCSRWRSRPRSATRHDVRHPRGLARTRATPVGRRRARRHHRRYGFRVHGPVRRAARFGRVRVGDPPPARHAVHRSAAARDHRIADGLRVLRRRDRNGTRAGLAHSRCRATARDRPAVGGGRGDRGSGDRSRVHVPHDRTPSRIARRTEGDPTGWSAVWASRSSRSGRRTR